MMKSLWLRSEAPDYDVLFVIEMSQLMSKHLDFELTVRKVLRDTLGENSSEVLSTMLGEEGLRDPETFSRRTLRLLGGGSRSLCLAVMEYANELVARGASLEN